MSGDYSGGTSLGSKWGYGIGCVVGLLIFGAGMALLLVGDCPPGASCHDGEGYKIAGLLLGAGLVATGTGLGIRKVVNRRKQIDR